MSSSTAPGPLHGVRVLELGGIGPVAFAGTVLADLGADVVRLQRPGEVAVHSILLRGRRLVSVDIRSQQAEVRQLAASADVVLEGFRPGAVEDLGLAPKEIHELNPAAIYGRMSGWGRSGPGADAPGHDINYSAVCGALDFLRGSDGMPVITPGIVGDFGGAGMTLVYGVLAALYEARGSGIGQVVDCSIVRSTATLLSAAFELAAQGGVPARMTSGEAPYYRAYRCADGRLVVVGALEPQFYAALRTLCGLTGAEWDDQYDVADWPRRSAVLEQIFAARSREEWAADPRAARACVSPVYDLEEAVREPQSRDLFVTRGATVQPDVGPELSRTPAAAREPAMAAELAAVRASWDGRQA